MIGDSITFSDLSTTVGSLPDATAEQTTVTKVNQDNYAAEYRFRGTAHDYLLKVRNTVETPRKDGVQFTRHNAEFTVTERGDPTADPPTQDVPYIATFTARFPKGGDSELMRQVMGHLVYRFCYIGTPNGQLLGKMLNFES